MFKRIETYFYIFFAMLCLFWLGVEPESVTVSFGIVTLNNLRASNIGMLFYFLCISSAVLCLVINHKVFLSNYVKASDNNSALLSFVNDKFKAITRSNKRVNTAKLQGFRNPTVNTGAWTFFKAAREQVIIDIPTMLSLKVRVQSWLTAFSKSFWQLSLPVTVGVLIFIGI